MKGILVRWLVLTTAILVTAYLIEGIHVSGFFSAFLTAAVLGILNAFLRPLLILLTLPINVLTLGLFTFVINAFLLMMASGAVSGFVVESFGYALLGSMIISIFNWALSSFINDQGQVTTIEMRRRDGDRWE